MQLDATTRRRDGVTLVELRVRNDGERRRVRVENRLDGPVWYPRRDGTAASGWDESGYAGVVPAEGSLALGYASPATPADPPAVVAETAPPDGPGDGDSGAETPGDVVAELGDPRPPRDATADGSPVPDAVAAWLDDLGERAPDLDERDREALATVRRRVAALRCP